MSSKYGLGGGLGWSGKEEEGERMEIGEERVGMIKVLDLLV